MSFSMAMAIDTSNAAFDDDPGRELARILRAVAVQLDAGDGEGICLDSCSNKVGVWKLRLPPSARSDTSS